VEVVIMYRLKGWGSGGGDKYFTYYLEALSFCEMMGISPKQIVMVH
jgi:hypothetical protein